MLKRLLSITIALVFTLGIFCIPVLALEATPTASTVLVNGENVAFDAYLIEGNNYFKLRDLAYTLSGTQKQFEVGYDGAVDGISLTSGNPYTTVGGEMTCKGDGAITPTLTSSKIIKDGAEVQFTAYLIGGNNYFKLRDIGAAFEFGVDWDVAQNTIVIDTAKGYVSEETSSNGIIITNSNSEQQIINPSEDLVISKLLTIVAVTGIQAATEDHDPNGKLHKAGGYTSAVYFSTSYIKQSDVYGESIVDKGTDCGGQIEVYETEKNASKRDAYLANMDGTILDSGSHKVLGTMVIRISSKSTATQQKELTEAIVAAFMNENSTSVINVSEGNKQNIEDVTINEIIDSLISYYIQHPSVPDFGAVFNVPLDEFGNTGSEDVYTYKESNIKTGYATEYCDMLQEVGFMYHDSPQMSSGILLEFKKGNLTVGVWATGYYLYIFIG